MNVTSNAGHAEKPETVAALSRLVRETIERGNALYPVGGGTHVDMGYTPTRPGITVDLRLLDKVIDYPARDMTITVQAGITIAKLQSILQAEGQQLPVEIPFPDRATLGGAIATNASGSRRYGFGTLRDYVIGISVINDQGEEIKAGGRVVKNVAGYDLMKLYTGSFGTLGIITQVTLKLKPLSEASALLALPVNTVMIGTMLDLLHATRTRPVVLDLLSGSACEAVKRVHAFDLPAEGNNACLIVGFEDNAKGVAWQIEQLKHELPREMRSPLRECDFDQRDSLMRFLRDFPLRSDAAFTFKANMLPSAVADFVLNALQYAPLLQAHAGNGIIVGHVDDLTLEQARKLTEHLGDLAARAKGNLIVTRCPAVWKSVLPIWGRSTGDWMLMKAIKAKLDPNHIFNPGRFVDGI